LIPVIEDRTQALNKSLRVILELPKHKDVIALPISSIYGTNGVFRVNDGRLESLTVSPVGYQYQQGKADKVLVIAEAINDGEKIITTQLPKAINGLKVTVQDESK